MKITYNNIIQQLKAFFDSHYQVNQFRNGDLWEAIESNSFDDALYPLAFLVDNGGNTSQGKVGLTFDLLCMDLVDKDEANENEVKSDTLRILLDAVAYLEQLRDGSWYNVQVEKQSTLSSFTEKFQDELTGWKITISLSQPFSYNACQIPYAGVSPIPEEGCEVLTYVYNSENDLLLSKTVNKDDNTIHINDSLIQLDGADGLELISNLPATEGLTLKVTNEDLETIPQVYVDGDNLVVEEMQIRNSDESFSQTIDYINDNTLADVPNVDSDGTIIQTPAMTPFVCTPATPTGIVTEDLYLNLDTSNVLSYNDPSSNWLDLTPYRNDSSLVSSPTYSAIYDGVLIYDGVNDYATITNDFELDMTQAWEMQFVLNLDSTFGAARPSLALLKTNSGVPINIFLDNNNGIWVASPGGITLQAFKNGNQIPLDENLIINLSFDGLNAFDINSFKLEINGVNESLLTSVNSGTTLNINYIGQTIGSHFYRFKGYIPRVFAWSRQLDVSEKQRQLDVLKAQYNIV